MSVFPRTHSRASFTHKNSESTYIFSDPRVLGRTYFRPKASKICKRTLILLHQRVLRSKSKRTYTLLDPSVSNLSAEPKRKQAKARRRPSFYRVHLERSPQRRKEKLTGSRFGKFTVRHGVSNRLPS